jgi:hypothetical protein
MASWLLIALATINAVRVLRNPEALRFFGFWLVVLAAVLAVGSIVALVIVRVRRAAGASQDGPRRITRSARRLWAHSNASG